MWEIQLPRDALLHRLRSRAVASRAHAGSALVHAEAPRREDPHSRSALEGERKQVTILFADVKGSTELASELDPEEWHGIMDRFFQILAEGVHRFEGTVNEYRGDGIMALFGAPIAHEDHAQRACYSALHLRDALRRYADELRIGKGISFSVRMGLNSGEVVVGKIGDDLRMDYTALGHTANLAARMEQIAEPGRIYLAEATAKIVPGVLRATRSRDAHEVRGLSQPVGVFELEGVGRVRTRLEVSRARGFTKFVGRQSEMAALEAALEQAIAGNAQVVGVVAEPGTGKSRLCYEFAERCRAREIPVYEAHGVAHGKAVPLLPILEFFRGYFGITEHDAAKSGARQDRRTDATTRRDARRAATAHVRFPRRAGSRAAFSATRSRGAAGVLLRPHSAACSRAERPGAGRLPLRGPSLVRSGERRVHRERRRRDCARQPDARAPEFPAGVPRSVDAQVLLPSAPAATARPRSNRGSSSPTCSAPIRRCSL